MNQSESAGIVHCWEKLLAAWEPASAMEAWQVLAAGTLFKDAREAGLEAPTAGAERRMSRKTPRRALPSGPPPSQRKTKSSCSMQYVDWDRFEAEKGDKAEAVEQGGGEQGVARSERVSVSIAVCGAWC